MKIISSVGRVSAWAIYIMIIHYSIGLILITYPGEISIKPHGLGIAPTYSVESGSVPAQILLISRADGPHSRLLDFLSSRWAWPIYSIFCRVNGPGPSSRLAVRVNGSEHIQAARENCSLSCKATKLNWCPTRLPVLTYLYIPLGCSLNCLDRKFGF